MGWLDTLAGNYDHSGAAAVYTATNEFSWGQTLGLPALQAAANIEVMNYQKDLYDDLLDDQKATLDRAIDGYIQRIDIFTSGSEMDLAYPSVPEAALYEPVSMQGVQADHIESNIKDLGRASRWGRCIARLHAQNDRIRMTLIDPRWVINMDLSSMTIGDLLRGKIATGDLMELMTDTAESALLTGRVGANRAATTRNITAERLRRQAAGRSELARKAEMMERVSPSKRMPDLRDMLRTPQQRLAFELTQAQLVQNSLQNVNNRNAEAPPWRMARLQLKLQRMVDRLKWRAAKASMFNDFVPNYAAILQPAINSILSNPKSPDNPFTFTNP